MDGKERVAAASGADPRGGASGVTPTPTQGVFGDRRVSGMPEAGSPTRPVAGQAASASPGPSGMSQNLASRDIGRSGSRFEPYSIPELPARFQWRSVYTSIKARWESPEVAGNVYAAPTFAAAVREIDRAVMDTHLNLRSRPGPTPEKVELAMDSLRVMRKHAKQRQQQSRFEDFRAALNHINRLTYAKNAELVHRDGEFAAALRGAVAQTPGPEALGEWLRQQAAATDVSSIERRYFTQLAEGLGPESDPWAVSRELVATLPAAGDAGQTERLQAAHIRLVRAMSGCPSQVPVPTGSGEPALAAPVRALP